MSRHVLRPESNEDRATARPSTLWWSSPEALERRRSFVIAAPGLDFAKGLPLAQVVELILQDAIARHRTGQGWSVAFVPWLDHSDALAQYVADLDLEERTADQESLHDFDRLTHKWQRRRRRELLDVLTQLGIESPVQALDVTPRDSALGAQLFVELFQRGWVYRAQTLVPFCHHCRRSVVDADLRVERVKATARVFRAQVSGFGKVEISTLHPELLLTAVAVAAGSDDLKALAMVGAEVRLPVTGRRVPVVHLPSHTGGLGRTLSLVAPSFNAADFDQASTFEWPLTQLLAADGTVEEGIDGFAGLTLEACRARVLELARSEGALNGRFSHVRPRAVHVACGSEVRPRLATPWMLRGHNFGRAADQLMEDSNEKFNHPAWQHSYRRKLSASTRPAPIESLWWEGAAVDSFVSIGSATDEVISERSCVGPRIPAAHCRACQSTLVALDLPTVCSGCGGALEPDGDVLRKAFGSALWTVAVAARRSRPAKVDCAVLGRDLLESWIPMAELVSQSLYGDTAIKHMIVHGAVHDRDAVSGQHEEALHAAIERWGGDAIRAAVFTAMADFEGAQDVALDASALAQGARVATGIREGLAGVAIGETNDIQYGAQLVRVEREVARAMDNYHLGWAYRLVSSFVIKRLHPAARMSATRYEALLTMLHPFHPEIARQASLRRPV